MRIIKQETIKVTKNIPMVEGVTCDGCGKPIEHHAYTKDQGGSAVAYEGSTVMVEINLTGQKAILDYCEECTKAMIENTRKNNEQFEDFALDYDDYLEEDKPQIIEQINRSIKAMGEDDENA